MLKAGRGISSQGHAAPQIAEHVEQQLQASYSEVLHEPIPARFLDVLDMLEGGDANKTSTRNRAATRSEPASATTSLSKL
ncbi:NepR family anti-sigma factor [Methylocystis echinoides]|uniref:Anti-sigma factor NepR domain-containing protein n=1 Tax=Methylocystis echinoides TaxID=29468 RepID=A0A9W6GTC9_9HYPH|nr:NepR family anti-sigma factor [Methylocystis echinoides]GLI92727.1 hypothetical protein LMG27198_17190 [Methylocystis echinoides]